MSNDTMSAFHPALPTSPSNPHNPNAPTLNPRELSGTYRYPETTTNASFAGLFCNSFGTQEGLDIVMTQLGAFAVRKKTNRDDDGFNFVIQAPVSPSKRKHGELVEKMNAIFAFEHLPPTPPRTPSPPLAHSASRPPSPRPSRSPPRAILCSYAVSRSPLKPTKKTAASIVSDKDIFDEDIGTGHGEGRRVTLRVGGEPPAKRLRKNSEDEIALLSRGYFTPADRSSTPIDLLTSFNPLTSLPRTSIITLAIRGKPLADPLSASSSTSDLNLDNDDEDDIDLNDPLFSAFNIWKLNPANVYKSTAHRNTGGRLPIPLWHGKRVKFRATKPKRPVLLRHGKREVKWEKEVGEIYDDRDDDEDDY